MEIIRSNAILPFPPKQEGNFPSSMKRLQEITTYIEQQKFPKALEEFNVFMAYLPPNVDAEVIDKAFQCLCTLIDTIDSIQEIDNCLKGLLKLSSDSRFIEQQQQLAFKLAEWHYKKGKKQEGEEKLKYFTNAIHYLGKAGLISASTTEIHRFASRLFKVSAVTLSFFKERLELAVGRVDNQKEVVRLVTNLEERFDNLCCPDEKNALIKLFYKQIRTVVSNTHKGKGKERVEATGLQSLESNMQLWLRSQSSSTNCFITSSYRQKLNLFRQDFRNLYEKFIQRYPASHETRAFPAIKEARVFQKNISEQFIAFIQHLIKDAFAILGDPPCKYDLRAMGSLGREEICPYSDLEGCILIEDIKHRPYFERLARLLELQIIGLGESTPNNLPVFTCLGQTHKSGFHIDSGGNPAIIHDLINTPQLLAQNQVEEDYQAHSLANTLRKTISLENNSLTLFEDYQKCMNAFLDGSLPQERQLPGQETWRKSHAIQLLTFRLQEYQTNWKDPFKSQSVNIKKDYTELLNHLINDLSLYFGISETNTIDIIDKLVEKGIFTKESGCLLKEAVAVIYLTRVGLHLTYGEQKEIAQIHPNENESDLPIHLLEKIYWLVLGPLYSKLEHCLQEKYICLESHFQDVDLIKEAFYQEKYSPEKIEDLKPLIAHLAHHLVMTPFDTFDDCLNLHELYYQLLSTKTCNEPLREIYVKTLELYSERRFISQIIDTLAAIPNPSGQRQAHRLENEKLQKAILAMTTDHPNPDPIQVKVRCPTLPEARYLRQEVIDQIIDVTGHLKRQYQTSAHPVACATYGGYTLHFKQKPTHPLMEYAIHTLSARIAGHLSPSTELARFEIEADGENLMYPVLISKTVQGETLENAKTIESKQLTWACLCALLTRPGDGRRSNYVIEEETKHIFCIDNDISFVNLTTPWLLRQTLHFFSALFCLTQELDDEILNAFTHLDLNLILHGWIEELIQKDNFYRNLKLFTQEEEKLLYNEDTKDRFKATILLRSGTVATLLVQFQHLQNCLRSVLKEKRTLKPLDLLQYLVTLRDQKQAVDRWVYHKYRGAIASSPLLKRRLQHALDRNVEVSLTSSQADGISLGREPSFTEIEQREEFGPEMAQRELFAFTLSHCSSGVIIDGKENTNWIEADFSKMVKSHAPDEERQRLVLKALTFLVEQKHSKPETLIFLNCAVLDTAGLSPFLHVGLKHLDLSGCSRINEEAIQKINKQCPHLKRLYLNHCSQLRAFGKQTLTFDLTYLEFSELRKLHIEGCLMLYAIRLDAPRLIELKADNNRRLRVLILKNKSQYIMMMEEIKKYTCLDFKKLASEAIKEFIISGLMNEILQSKEMSELIKLMIENKNIIGEIANINTIDLLKLYYNKVEILNLSSKQTSDMGAEILAQALFSSTSLKELNLGDNKIGDNGAKALAHALVSNTSLQKLNLHWNYTGDNGAKALAQALFSSTSLKELNLSSNKIGDNGAKALAQALVSNTSLKELNLGSNKIGDIGAVALAQALVSNTSLKELNLGSNKIGDNGAKALAQALVSNTSLKELNLRENKIGDNGAVALAQVLVSNTSLEHLNLDANKIGDNGAKALAQALLSNTSLKELYLYGNKIGDIGAVALAQAFVSNTSLKELYLRENKIGDNGAVALANACALNTSLKLVYLPL